MYLFFKNQYKDEIKNLIKTRYELRKELIEMIKEQEFNKQVQDLIEGRIIKDKNENYDEKVDNIVKSISEKFVNIF